MGRRYAVYIFSFGVFVLMIAPQLLSNQPNTEALLIGRSQSLWMLVGRLPVFAIVLAASLSGNHEARRSRGWMRPRARHWLIASILLVFGVAMAALLKSSEAYTIVEATPITIAALIAGAWIAAVSEEAFFRSWILTEFPTEGALRIPILMLSAAAFSSLHLWQGPSAAVFAALMGLAYGAAFLAGTPVLPLILSHGFHNTLAMVLLFIR